MVNRHFHSLRIDRRTFMAGAAAATAAGLASAAAVDGPAQIAITLDLEMSRNFPTWETAHWDYEKGNLNAETKAYAVEAARRVKQRGGRVHFFLLGRTLEQDNVDWLKQLIADGHPIGNHTYDHVNVRATRAEGIQFRFQRSPWLIAGRSPTDVIRENIQLTTAAMKSRLGISPAGFRTPGGFANGLVDRNDLQNMLLDLGFTWVSSQYPGHKLQAAREGEAPAEPSADVIENIATTAADAQPFRYSSGLVEVPMSPISDIGAFRTGRWKLDWFLRAIRAGIERVMERGGVFDFLGHPSCLYITDPQFKTIDLICDLVERAGPRAAFVDLTSIAAQIKNRE
jgi:peptidoglycan/xylan/chitin deacetylase (PgdA/CDA1 family)